MSDPGPAIAVIQPQLDVMKSQLNASLNMIRQVLDHLAGVAEKATRGEDVTGDLAAARGMIAGIPYVS